MQRKKMLIAVLAIALLVGVVSAGVIQYFGQIQMTANVRQAILLDGRDYTTMPITETPVDVAGGESFCKPHWLTSQTSVPVELQFVTTYSPTLIDDEITVKYYAMGTSTTWHVEPSGDPFDQVEAYVTKTDKVGSVEFKVEIVPNSDHYGMGIAISTDVDTIDFQVFYQDWQAPYVWYYQEYGEDLGGPYHGWETTTPVALPHLGITATGDRTGKVFTVDIPIGLLGGCGAEYYFAIQFRTTLMGTYPQKLDLWAQTTAENFALATVGTEIPEATPFTLQPSERLDFYICYKFAVGIYPYIYTITTTV